MKKLLIVDDERLVRKKLETLMDYTLLGLQLIGHASDGAEGEKLILAHQPDVVITDIVMPEKSGLEMISDLQGRTAAKFIILSGYQDFEYVREALRLGATDYVLKPVQVAELTNALERVLDLHAHADDDVRQYGEIVAHVLSLVAEELSDPDLSLKNLCANTLFMNETYVGRLFQKRTGQKFSTYLTSCRIQAAQSLLVSQPQLTIGDVAERVGFGTDTKYFSEVFRKTVGVTPRRYRQGQSASDEADMPNDDEKP